MSGQHQRLPLEVDPFRLATKEEQLKGAIPLKQMKRLVSSLCSDEGDVLIDVVFSVDLNRVGLLSGTIQADIKLICQRCMEEMDLPVKLDFQIAFARSEAEMERLPEEYEVTLIEDTPIMLSDLIEDEILLALPTIPKHLDDNCSSDNVIKSWNSQQKVETNTEDVKRENPFDVLASLKTDK